MLSRLFLRYWLLLPLLILVVIAIDRIETPVEFELEQTINMRETRSDYYMAEFRSRKFGKDGGIEYTVEGETLAHYPDTNRSAITRPRIELNRPEATWFIQSNTGQFDTSPDLFTLEGEVVVTRQRPDSAAVRVLTNRLTVSTASNEVATAEPVEIVADHWTLKATGMKSAIDDGKLTLLSSVHGRYEVPTEQR